MEKIISIFERLIIAAAFFMLGWFIKGMNQTPCVNNTVFKNDSITFIPMDTIFKPQKEKIKKLTEKIKLYKNLIKLSKDSIVTDTFQTVNEMREKVGLEAIEEESYNEGRKDSIILYQDTIIKTQAHVIDTMMLINNGLNTQLDSCENINKSAQKFINLKDEQIKRDNKIKVIYGVVTAVLTSILTGILIK